MTKTLNPQDMTPEELRMPLLEAAYMHIPFDGWSLKAFEAAALDLGFDKNTAAPMVELAFPDGVRDMLAFHLEKANRDLTARMQASGLEHMKIRDKITTALRVRFEMQAPIKDVVRRGLSALALPAHAGLGARALWNTADCIWRGIGDTSTDHNWYTKRATLSAVYSATLLYWLNDDSKDHADTWAFLDRRIENVMQFEKAKFNWRKTTENLPSLSRFISRLRYPV